jgi:hypothetical protein
VVADLDPHAPLFFLSYAHSGQDQPTAHEAKVAKFYKDLTDFVSQMVGRVPGQQMGFVDRSIPHGSRWTDDLLDALGSCRTFVPLLSRPYASAAWCGMEWYAFSQRKVQARGPNGGNQTAFFPVIWAPIQTEECPQAIQEVQRFSPAGFSGLDLERKYNEFGLLGMMETMGRRTAYKAIVWSLAQSIANFSYSHEVEPRIFHEEDLRNVFEEGSP